MITTRGGTYATLTERVPPADWNCGGAILMFSLTSPQSYDALPAYYNDFRQVHGREVPVVVVGHQADSPNRAVPPARITFPRENGLRYVEVSSWANHNYEVPLLWLKALRFLGGADVELLSPLKLQPARAAVDLEALAWAREQMAVADRCVAAERDAEEPTPTDKRARSTDSAADMTQPSRSQPAACDQQAETNQTRAPLPALSPDRTERCAAVTKSGKLCTKPKSTCPWHQGR